MFVGARLRVYRVKALVAHQPEALAQLLYVGEMDLPPTVILGEAVPALGNASQPLPPGSLPSGQRFAS
jgi:hypothetical protein